MARHRRMIPVVQGLIRRHGVLLALTLIIIIHAVDRLAIVILLEDIKHDLALSDAQLGVLSGFAFVALYVVAGIPMAFLSDRSNRSRMIGLALTAMGGMTMLCGMAQNFLQLIVARCGLGISASPCVPAAHSIIADLYPPTQRTTALSITESGFFVGSFIGLWVCGWIATDFGWRTAFFAIGSLPLLLGVGVLLWLRDPVRGVRVQNVRLGFRATMRTIISIRSVRWYVAGSGFAVFASAGMMTWLPTLMIRSYGMTRTEAGGTIGAINGVGGLILTIVVGILADRLAQREARWNLWLPAILFALSAPFAALAFLSQSVPVLLGCFAIAACLITACGAPVISYSQQITPSNVHAMVTASIFLVFNILGFGLAPLAVGALSDYLTEHQGAENGLQLALLYLTAPSLVISAVLVFMGSRMNTRPTAILV
ncbi:spinster family MFS transporter [Sphingobium subterraneum]|uniref:Putative MFS family arabinose efflux permease n=1 Tax=Sphingobium subterraneum TaxID=627688 RepID=A0A841J3D0_9SPHN|nr:MFS transporter [Sphingobium subterraneum]MBB6125284.1 putative MFS family arabinose efflux permease [Sphingobium subterraneum]